MVMKHKISKYILILLCIGMPFHSIFFAVTGLEFLTLWRDLLIVIELMLILYARKGRLKIKGESLVVALSIIGCSIFAVANHSNRVSTGVWINSLRIYVGAFFAYYIGIYFSRDMIFREKIYTLYVKTACIVSLWGIFQMFFLGEKFLWDIGFGISSAVLANGFQRNVGVFSSANLMGIYVVIGLIILMYGDVKIRRKNVAFTILGISLLLTMSTSAILGFVCALVYHFFRNNQFKNFLSLHKKSFRTVGLILLFGIIVIGFDQAALQGKISGLIIGRFDETLNTLHFKDVSGSTSSSIHMMDLIRSADIVKHNFWGLGFSDSTFILLGRVQRSMLTYTVESSLFTILFDFGVVFGLIYLLPFIIPFFEKRRACENEKEVARPALIALLVLYVFLPLVSCIELRFFVFLFLGMESADVKAKERRLIL